MFEKVKSFVADNYKKAGLALMSGAVALSSSGVGVTAYASESGGAGGGGWVSSIDVSPITDNITAAIPVVLPALISILAIRKGLSFVIGTIRKA